MPELPEVEVVRRGLERWVAGRVIEGVEVLDPRSVRRHGLGVEDFRGNLVGATVLDVIRRGKFLWLPLAMGKDRQDGPAAPDESAAPAGTDESAGPAAPTEVVGPGGLAQPQVALVAHLGMSGQLLLKSPQLPDEKHLKVRFTLSTRGDEPVELRFVDQRIFGGLFVTDLVPTSDGLRGGQGSDARPQRWPLIPVEASHIARDPLDPDFSIDALHRKLRARKTGLKRALLDQGLVSGIGNIYADEALWDAKLHFARPTDTLRRPDTERVVNSARDVMARALEAGGTSFDSLYVNVNGSSGYFARNLNVYGLAGYPCKRCGTAIVRERFMNRSSFFCPRCQRKRYSTPD